MITFVELGSIDAFDKYVKDIDPRGPEVFFYFSGKKNDTGVSWCPDCVEAEPIIKQYLSNLQKNIIFAYVDAGEKDYWRNKDCPFRTDKRIKLLQLPTLMKWKGVQRLEGSQCNKQDLLQMLFEDEE